LIVNVTAIDKLSEIRTIQVVGFVDFERLLQLISA
jgi:hypothetical protein